MHTFVELLNIELFENVCVLSVTLNTSYFYVGVARIFLANRFKNKVSNNRLGNKVSNKGFTKIGF